MWAPALDPSHIHFNCTWLEVYPTPMLSWVDNQGDEGSGQKGHVYVSEETNSLSVMLNRSMLSDGQTLRCVAQHVVLPPGKERSCSFTISKYVVVKCNNHVYRLNFYVVSTSVFFFQDDLYSVFLVFTLLQFNFNK